MENKKKTLYRLKIVAGNHQDATGIYLQGSVIETTEPLHERFANKFEVISKGGEPSLVTNPQPATENASQGNLESNSVGFGDEPDEINVTDQFELAQSSGLKVVRHPEKRLYNVFDADPETPINDSPLKSKKAVVDFVEEHVK